MTSNNNELSVHVNVKISAAALQSIVNHAKQLASRDANGTYRVDTADQVSMMITRFLNEKGFESYVQDIDNYRIPSPWNQALRNNAVFLLTLLPSFSIQL